MKWVWFICCCAFSALAAPQPLVVHEWGTFTSLQDETGRTLGSLNSDDEPLPPFAHELDYFHRLKPGELPPVAYQGAPSSHPAVTMRLETPVVYFHPSISASLPIVADVKVLFYSGWLTQFYPNAESQTNGFSSVALGTRSMPGWLKWSNLKIGGDARGPETTERVWTAPRAVRAASVTTRTGESEKFLFYRGVAQIDAPLRVSRSGPAELAVQQGWLEPGLGALLPMKIRKLWLAQFRPDGTCAFRLLEPILLENASETNRILQTVPSTFAAEEFSRANLQKLQAAMRSALIVDGLFTDEADALLNTWELSYFKSWGLRLFFLVPRAWTDYRLPIEISVPNDLTRVMVGRIELVTEEHRALLRELAEAAPEKSWARYELAGNRRVMKGTMPPAYRDLGRFRNALVLDEEKQRPTKALKTFIRLNGLEASSDLD